MNHARVSAPVVVEADRAPMVASPDDHRGAGGLFDDIPKANKDSIVTSAPEEPFRLTFIDVTCLLINRTIGTGIFNGPQVIMNGVKTPGKAMLLWFCGCIYCLCGAHVFLEYGLNVPRYIINGIEQAVPRSGGELHYLQSVFPAPRYRKGTVILVGVMFGISFICVGNMASNCIDCALRLCQLAGEDDPGRAKVRGIAIAIATATCFIHAFSRRGGIFLNNIFAVVKFLFLLSMVVATWVVVGSPGGLKRFADETQLQTRSSPNSEDEGTSAAQAFLFVVFAFFGFDQPSYVLGEIKHPRKNFPRAMWWGMGMMSVLYLAVNVCYRLMLWQMLVVPASVQVQGNVAEEFFARIYGNKHGGAQKTVDSFLAISSFGNVVVWTFTAARMKQEIAKQWFLPFASFFAMDKDVSFGRLLSWMEASRLNPARRLGRFFNPSSHKEKTPVGAFVLHLITCIVLILATYRMSARDAYLMLTSLFSYLLAACFGSALALGILILHWWGPPKTKTVTPKHRVVPEQDQEPAKQSWRDVTKGVINPTLSIVCAVAYLIGSLYPVIASWIPPSKSPTGKPPSVKWYAVPVTAFCILGFSTLWFYGFMAITAYRGHAGQNEFVYRCHPVFAYADVSSADPERHERASAEEGAALMRRGGLILVHEAIHKTWRAREMNGMVRGDHSNGIPMRTRTTQPSDRQPQQHANDLSNTDFAGFSQDLPFGGGAHEQGRPLQNNAAQTSRRPVAERIQSEGLFSSVPISPLTDTSHHI
ncbi:hypothetical protein LLEC1_07098 [Akanthomyces lecanii]|uniref:Uncharacterized protein n=1 Tax=Cordyceps confragosa TaxID=2714763 RepID=A0A179IKI2_CORDF|nr:hypothetical protein LLEC1_07098 [Akanthomyces lecanii]